MIDSTMHVPQFIDGRLSQLSVETILNWLDDAKKIDAELSKLTSADIKATSPGSQFIAPELLTSLQQIVTEKDLKANIDLSTIQVFDGYYLYEYPDGGQFRDEQGLESAWYGVAKVSKIDRPHIHKKSDSFNFILEGEGIFYGSSDDEEKFDEYHHGALMYPGAQFFIPAGMTHGHVVRKDRDMWLFFIQEIGFREGLEGEGDYHVSEDFSILELAAQFH